MKIDIGGGTTPAPEHTNLDPVHGDGVWRRRAQDVPWPVATASVESLYSSHVLEHIPAGAERIDVMNEAWRVLVPGGRFEIRVPRFPTWESVADPTHVSYWVPESFGYFTGVWAPNADYAIAIWREVQIDTSVPWEIRAILEKPQSAS